MVSKTPLGSREIIELLSRLKAETPEYPADMLAARKAAFIKQAASLNIQAKGQGGEGGQQGGSGGSSGSGTALGGSTTVQGIILQSLIGIGLIATILVGMLTGNYLFHDQISDGLEENIVAGIESPAPTDLQVPGASATPTQYETVTATPEPTITVTVTESNPTLVNPDDDPALIDNPSDSINEDQGLHLGQTPGTPAAPGHGNPGNQNKPDKQDKPDKPDKGR